MNKKKNYWKIGTLVLGVLVVSLIVFYIINQDKLIEIKTINGVSVNFPQKFVDEALEINKYSDSFTICSTIDDKCVLFKKLN